MARGKNQKLKLLYLIKLLLEQTDDEHGIDINYIIEKLSEKDISVERKSLYSDFEALNVFGIDVNKYKKDRNYFYYVGERQFEKAELKLLVDAVQSSKFITEKKSRGLIKKLEALTSKHIAKELQRQVLVNGRIKTMNESIYYNVDDIHNAINENKKIKFQYYQWNLEKEMEPRHNGEYYYVSPWALLWDNDNYYLIGYDEKAEKIKHYRVDKMRHISILEEERIGKEIFMSFNMAEYDKKRFSMFDGEIKSVEMICSNELIGVMLDRFGKDIFVHKENEEKFFMRVEVAVSQQFLGWIIALGEKVKIVSPEELKNDMLKISENLNKMYKE